MSWTNIPKPGAQSYTKLSKPGAQSYTNITKPLGSVISIVSPGATMGLLIPLTRSTTSSIIGSYWTKITKPT